MCWGVCITKRGMVYFGASIHIFVSLLLFIGSSIRAYHLSTYDREDSRKEILGGAILATYFFVILMLGCLIFRATEQKNAKMLGWTSGTFITLETFAFVFNLIILSPMGVAYDEYGLRNFGFTVNIVYIVISCIVLLAMMAYCATIIMYISKLKEDGDRNSSADYTHYGEYDGEAGVEPTTNNALSRNSSRTPSTFFQSQLMDPSKDSGSGAGMLKLLEVVREAKKAQMITPGQTTGNAVGIGANSTKTIKRPMTPQQVALKDHPHAAVKERPPSRAQQQIQSSAINTTTTTIVEASKPPSAMRQQSQSSESQTAGTTVVVAEIGKGTTANASTSTTNTMHIPPQPQGPAPILQMQPKFQEVQTQTMPSVPYPPMPPLHHYSQTLPHQLGSSRRNQGQSHGQGQSHHIHPPATDDYFQEYGQRGILSAPSFTSVVNTASIAPNRFRNPNSSVLRTTKSGTLLGRYDSLSPPPAPLGSFGGTGGTGRMQRQTSSSCSYLSDDPNNPNSYSDEHWELPRVQALKYNYHYNALRRGTHRSDYGVEV